MGFREGATEAVVGIVVGIIISVLMKSFAGSIGSTIVAVIQLGAILAFLRDVELVENIPLMTGIGYFGTTLTVGQAFLEEWELGLQTILLLVFIMRKLLG